MRTHHPLTTYARRAITRRGLIALGVAGGLIPCPSALVVLLAAIAQHRVGLGMLLIFAFSLGLAATLTAIGLAVHLRRRARRTTPPRAASSSEAASAGRFLHFPRGDRPRGQS